MKRVRWMNDGTIGVLSTTWMYYIRHMYKGKSYTERQKKYPFDRIEYYTLRGKYIPLARAECEQCWEIVQSQYCWHFTTCSCLMTSVDTDRWSPERHRIIVDKDLYRIFKNSQLPENKAQNFFNTYLWKQESE